jgi:hypothetical protein
MRTLLVIPISIALAVSACSLYWDDHHTANLTGPDAGNHYPDANVCLHHDGGSCFIPDAAHWPDAEVGSDGGCHDYPDAAFLPDGGIVVGVDAGSYGWDAH